MTKLLLYFLSLSLINISHEKYNETGTCPNVQPVANFDILKFAAGVWLDLYHITDDRAHLYDNTKCVQRTIQYDEKTKSLKAQVCRTYKTESELPTQYTTLGNATDTPGVLIFTRQHALPPFNKITFHVLDTDYDTYAIGMTCSHDPTIDKHYITTVAIVRPDFQPTSSKRDQNSVAKLFSSFGVSMVTLDYNECRKTCGYK